MLLYLNAMTDIGTRLVTPGAVGAAIRARRRELGMDQSALAEKAGVSRLWIGQIEAGKPGASLALVLRTFAALGLTLRLDAHEAPEPDGGRTAPARAVDLAGILDAARKKPVS